MYVELNNDETSIISFSNIKTPLHMYKSTQNGAEYTLEDGRVFLNLKAKNYKIKQEKEVNVAKIRVTTTTGKVFDGDEKSQDRMTRAINIAAITEQVTTQWKLADNSVVEVTLAELKEALSLAGQEMNRIWLEN